MGISKSGTSIFNLTFSVTSCRKLLLESLLLINLFFALFPAWRLSPLWSFIPLDGYFSKWLYLLDFINLFLCGLIIIIDRKPNSKFILIGIILLATSFIISSLVNGFKSDTANVIFFFIEYIVLFTISNKSHFNYKLFKFIAVTIALWAIIPMAILVTGPNSYRIAMFTGVGGEIATFGGFALHRNFYGFYVGIAIILFVILKFPKWVKFIIILLLSIGLLISASRSSLLCTIGAVMLYTFLTNKKAFLKYLPILITIGAFILASYAYLGIRDKGLEDNNDRNEILTGFMQIISRNPIFGNGEYTMFYSTHYPFGAPAHNFIAQIWADYGIITLLIFLSTFAMIYFKGGTYIKVFLAYLILFGLSQPYFFLAKAQVYMFITVLLGNCMSPSAPPKPSSSHKLLNKIK